MSDGDQVGIKKSLDTTLRNLDDDTLQRLGEETDKMIEEFRQLRGKRKNKLLGKEKK